MALIKRGLIDTVYVSRGRPNPNSQGSFTRFPSSTLCPFSFWVDLLKPNSRKKGGLIINGLLGNLVYGGLLGPRAAIRARELGTRLMRVLGWGFGH